MTRVFLVFLFWLWFSVLSSPILFGLAVVVIIACLLVTRKVSRTRRVAWRTAVILGTVLVFSIVSACKINRFCSHVVEPKAYEAVEVAMTRDRVANLLGEPPDSNLTAWRYDKPGVWEYAVVYFDENGKVKQKFLDR